MHVGVANGSREIWQPCMTTCMFSHHSNDGTCLVEDLLSNYLEEDGSYRATHLCEHKGSGFYSRFSATFGAEWIFETLTCSDVCASQRDRAVKTFQAKQP
jgi:hypothetical protein